MLFPCPTNSVKALKANNKNVYIKVLFIIIIKCFLSMQVHSDDLAEFWQW